MRHDLRGAGTPERNVAGPTRVVSYLRAALLLVKTARTLLGRHSAPPCAVLTPSVSAGLQSPEEEDLPPGFVRFDVRPHLEGFEDGLAPPARSRFTRSPPVAGRRSPLDLPPAL